MEIKHLLKLLFFILIGVTARIFPHPANFTPIGAIALFGGRFLEKKYAFIIPIATMMISDAIIGFDGPIMRVTIYSTLILITIVGLKVKNTIHASLGASLVFFITTNFSVWLFGTMYTKNLMGLLECFYMGLPFFRNTILGDLFYSTLLISLPSWLWNKRMDFKNFNWSLFISK